ncbi:hypothetical protein AB9T89_13985 [Flavobacterium oncorhynchi]|uniref:hypothetical protein n=1 Tax=Flavobacterium oncorhynchi TaxID=728056 RepID=UPI003519F474
MKFSKRIILVLIVLFSSCAFSQTTSKIIGEWSGIDSDGNQGKFIFTKDNYASLTISGEFIDGKKFIIRGGKNDSKSGELKYTIDYSKSPFTIDFIASIVENNKLVEKGRILGIIKFINDTKMLLAFSLSGKRDADFNGENMSTSMILTKIN